jgi:hypothetical protein
MKIEILARKTLRKIARTIVRFPAKWYFDAQFNAAFTDAYDAFWVVDIDNTIADSWKKLTPQYRTQFSSMSDGFMSIEPFESMQRLLQNAPPRTRIVFLTARQYIRYFVTKRWLVKHGFWQTDSVLVLVEHMRDKAPLLAGVLDDYFEKKTPPQYTNDLRHHPITFFDDLSYNHEKGEVLFYNDVIDTVQKMPIKYIGYEELLLMQKNS